LSEFYPGLEVTAWIGIFAPANVPAPVLARLHGEVNRLLVGAQLRDKVLAVGGLEPFVTTPRNSPRSSARNTRSTARS